MLHATVTGQVPIPVDFRLSGYEDCATSRLLSFLYTAQQLYNWHTTMTSAANWMQAPCEARPESTAHRHKAPSTEVEEQNMIDLALALSMCDSTSLSNSRYPSPQPRASAPPPDAGPLVPPHCPGASPATSPTSTATHSSTPPPQTHHNAPDHRQDTASHSPAQGQRFMARTDSGRTQRCAACNNPFVTFGGFSRDPPAVTVIERDGKLYHPECVQCKACGKPISRSYVPDKAGNIYHEGCFKRKFGLTCDCCHKRIASVGGRVEFMTNRFWKERYCPAHEHDGSVSCTGCARLRRPESEDIVALGDGRSLCLECLSSFIPDTAAAQPVYEGVLRFYAEEHGMTLPEQPPLMLVEHTGLNEACNREGRSGGIGPATHTRGLCLIEHVSSVRTGRITRGASGALTSSSELVPLRHDKNTYVVAILVLAGLPAVVTGAVIAHEVMHAWLRMHGIRKMTEQAEEGLCQLMSYLWLEAQNIEGDEMQARLASYVGYQIRTHPSETYGKGFVLALEAYQRFGLKAVLDHVRQTRELPAV
eukprot:jgi/Ulvmu1/5399/UM022_0194.1